MTGRHTAPEPFFDRPGSSPDLTTRLPALHRDRPWPDWLSRPMPWVVAALMIGAFIISWTFAAQENRINSIAGPVLDRCAVGGLDRELCDKAQDVRSDPIVVPPTVTTTETVRVPVPGAPGAPRVPQTTTVTTTVPAPDRPPVTVTTTAPAGAPVTHTVRADAPPPVTRTRTEVETETRVETTVREVPGDPVTVTVTETETETADPDPVTVTVTETATETAPPDNGGGGGGLIGGLLGP